MSMTPSKPAISRPLAMVRLRFFAALLLLALSSVGVIVVLNPKISSTDSSAHLPEVLSKPPASGGVAAKCTFCKGEESNFNQDWVVPESGGNTCGSMKAMAAGQLNGSDICALIQEKERVCCPGLPASTNATKHQVTANKSKGDGDGNMTTSHPPILYGHVHMAKTGGTSLNGILANTFEHVCGHKGYSYDAFQDNERAKIKVKEGQNIRPEGRSRVFLPIMKEIGFEDCDYISAENSWMFWRDTFGNGKFHGLKMELHVPCRDRLDHLMSQCNYLRKEIACDAKTDEELFNSVKKCYVFLLDRYAHHLQKHFDVKCFDFKKQFTDYTEYMSGILQKRRFQSTPYVKRETNRPRNQTNECIWGNETVLEKVEKYLLETVPYYQFCDQCMGSENEITLQQQQ
eukprot:scaffold8679_cov154-Skeletonema_menzelii.AAC.2